MIKLPTLGLPTLAPPTLAPPALMSGERVAIVAPASNLREENLARGVAELEQLGFRASYRPDILSKDRYTAGDDARRAAELFDALSDPSTAAVWAARGGYGAMRLLRHLDRLIEAAPNPLTPKPFIGYSDMTALHLYLYSRFGWITFHGPMVAKDLAAGKDHYDRATLLQAISPAPRGPVRWDIIAGGLETLHPASPGRDLPIRGRLLGGCLSLIVSLVGTPFQLHTEDSILFLEDTGTRPYAIDRMLQQLRLAGCLAGVRAIIFGEMTNCQQHVDQGYRLQEVLADCTADLGVPVLFGLRSGHSPVGNLTLPLGVTAEIDPACGRLTILESAVSLPTSES